MSGQQFNRTTHDRALDEELARLRRRLDALDGRLSHAESAALSLAGTVQELEVSLSALDTGEAHVTFESAEAGIPIPTETAVFGEGFAVLETGVGTQVDFDASEAIAAATEETVTSLEDLGLAFRRLLVNLEQVIGGDFLDDDLMSHYEQGVGEQ